MSYELEMRGKYLDQLVKYEGCVLFCTDVNRLCYV